MNKVKKWAPIVSRYLLGILFFMAGGAGLLGYAKPPPETPEMILNWFNAMSSTGYFIPVLKATETICGILLISGFAPALALVILAPITIQIFLAHAFLTPGVQNLIQPVIIIALHVTAASAYWRIYRPLFSR